MNDELREWFMRMRGGKMTALDSDFRREAFDQAHEQHEASLEAYADALTRFEGDHAEWADIVAQRQQQYEASMADYESQIEDQQSQQAEVRDIQDRWDYQGEFYDWFRSAPHGTTRRHDYTGDTWTAGIGLVDSQGRIVRHMGDPYSPYWQNAIDIPAQRPTFEMQLPEIPIQPNLPAAPQAPTDIPAFQFEMPDTPFSQALAKFDKQARATPHELPPDDPYQAIRAREQTMRR